MASSLITHVTVTISVLPLTASTPTPAPIPAIKLQLKLHQRLVLPTVSTRRHQQEEEPAMTDAQIAARLRFLAKKLNILVQRDPPLYQGTLEASDILDANGHFLGPSSTYHTADVDIMAVLDEISFISDVMAPVLNPPYDYAGRPARMRQCIESYHARHSPLLLVTNPQHPNVDSTPSPSTVLSSSCASLATGFIFTLPMIGGGETC